MLTLYEGGLRKGGKDPRSYNLKGGQCKTPVMQLRGSGLKQPPVIDAFLTSRLCPFTLTWPDREVRTVPA